MPPLRRMAPHTGAKHLLLKRYLDRWFPILGKGYSRINYIDGFAGPGEYDGGFPGSPLIAIDAALAHVERGTLAKDVQINFICVEADPESVRHLHNRLRLVVCPPQFRFSILEGEFSGVIGQILDRVETNGKNLAPSFAFVDPFGFSGIPFDIMARILSHPRCEVFVNVMIEFINRFLDHPNDKVSGHFPVTFGTNEVLSIAKDGGDRIGALLALYRRQLASKARFVGKFDMHGRKDQITYSLFFASNSPLGFHKMKEAMWSVDRMDGGSFSDFEPGAANQGGLFTLHSVWDDVCSVYAGRTVQMSELDRFVIEHTDFLPKHLRAALREREERGQIQVQVAAGQKRRKGDFPATKVQIVIPP